MMVQMFYSWRIYVLTKNRWITSAIIATSIVGGRESYNCDCISRLLMSLDGFTVSGIGTSIAVAMRPDFAGFHHLKVILHYRTNLRTHTMDTITSSLGYRHHLVGRLRCVRCNDYGCAIMAPRTFAFSLSRRHSFNRRLSAKTSDRLQRPHRQRSQQDYSAFVFSA